MLCAVYALLLMLNESCRITLHALQYSATFVDPFCISYTMPTFQSIGVHPKLRTRLVTENCDERQLVLTPQALLSRNPTALRLLEEDGSSSRPISLPRVQELRLEVATALIAQSISGKRIRRIQKAEGSSRILGTVSALDLLHHELQSPDRQSPPVVSTGCRKLDELIALPAEYCNVSTRMDIFSASAPSSGVPFGYVTEISGPPGSAKTQIALQLATSSGLHQTWYLHSGQANATRLWDVSNHNYNVMQRSIFASVADEYQVLKRLAELEAFLNEESPQEAQQEDRAETASTTPSTVWKPVLLVLDSCSGCLSPDSGLLLTVQSAIKRMTRQYGLATVLVNGTVSNRSAEDSSNARSTKAALGRSWRAVADVHVWLEVPRADVHRANVERHSAKRCDGDTAATFRVTSQGIQDVP